MVANNLADAYGHKAERLTRRTTNACDNAWATQSPSLSLTHFPLQSNNTPAPTHQCMRRHIDRRRDFPLANNTNFGANGPTKAPAVTAVLLPNKPATVT